MSIVASLGGHVTLIASVRGARRWYDDYLEGLLGVARHDGYAEAAAGVAWQLHPRTGIDLRVTAAKNWSTADISRYEVVSGGVLLRTAFHL